jgi:hypothetical protein
VAPDELLTQAARVSGVLAADSLTLFTQSGSSWAAAASLPLKPWQVPALQGVAVVTDGSAPPAPPDSSGGGTSGQTLVPVVPKVC